MARVLNPICIYFLPASMPPFLSLGIENVQVVILTEIEGSVRKYIKTGNYDTVIIAYAQSMIGGM